MPETAAPAPTAALPADPDPDPGRRGLAGWSVASIVLLAAGGWLTSLGLGDWYDALDFPPYQPPGWVFTPAWVVILTLLALATARLGPRKYRYAAGETIHPRLPLAYLLYGAQFVLNAGWSLLFFTLQRPDAALWEILALDAVVLAMVVAYGRIDRVAGLMLVPYFLWLLYSTAINAWIALHNGPFG